MTETAQAKAMRLMGEVDRASKATYAKGEVKTILNNIAQTNEAGGGEEMEGCRAPCATKAPLRRGDVFIAKLVGGKVRPWIVLRTDGETVTALTMSHGDTAPGMKQAACRFWEGSWIGTTVSLFDMDFAQREVTRPYTNLAHLAEIEADLLSIYGGAAAPSVTSLSEIRQRRFGGAVIATKEEATA